jgi:small subunit ribosomal protein S21
MPGIVIRDGDSFEAALKRFKKQVEKAGVLAEVRKREAFEKPTVKRKKKEIAAKKRARKEARGPRKPRY